MNVVDVQMIPFIAERINYVSSKIASRVDVVIALSSLSALFRHQPQRVAIWANALNNLAIPIGQVLCGA